jgi:hypothetical protein
MDCHVAALLAMTDMGYRHCERSVAIHEPVDCRVAALLAMTNMGYCHCERSVAIHAFESVYYISEKSPTNHTMQPAIYILASQPRGTLYAR